MSEPGRGDKTAEFIAVSPQVVHMPTSLLFCAAADCGTVRRASQAGRSMGIAGIGVDLVRTARVAAAAARGGPRFLARVLSADEQRDYAQRMASPPSSSSSSSPVHAARAAAFLASRYAYVCVCVCVCVCGFMEMRAM
jgi:hypothetical protein